MDQSSSSKQLGFSMGDHLQKFESNMYVFESSVGTRADIDGHLLKMNVLLKELSKRQFISTEEYEELTSRLQEVEDKLEEFCKSAFAIYDSLSEEQLFLHNINNSACSESTH